MAKISAVQIPFLVLEEVASDGSTVTTPAADHRATFIGEDGLIHVKDSAGAVTSPYTGGISSGTSNPGSPTTNDLFFRTDLGLLIYYTGAAWHSVQQFDLPTSIRNAPGVSGYNATTTTIVNAVVPTTSIYLTTFEIVGFVGTTNTGSAFWTVDLYKLTPANVATSIASISTGTAPDAANTWVTHDVAVNATLASATNPVLRIGVAKTSTPGDFILAYTIRYRVVVA